MKKYYLFILIFWLIFFSSCQNMNEAKSVVEDFYETRKTQQNEKLFIYFSDELLEENEQQKILETFDALDQKFGKLNTYKPTSFNITTQNNVSTVKFSYKVVYQNGVTIDTLKLVKIGGEYKIETYFWKKNKSILDKI